MKQNCALKKTITLLMAFFLFALTGCQGGRKDLPTMEIFTEDGPKEVPMVTLVTDVGWQSTNLRAVLNRVPGSGREFQITIEPLPRTEPERSNRLTRIRTEMMAGEGPDMFIMDLQFGTLYGSENSDGLLDPLFPFPEKAMKNRLFLPLDEYMENAGYSDFSAFMPALMELGRNDEGQQILPLTFDFDVARFSTDTYDIPIESTGTREDMLNSGVPILEYFAGTLPGTPLDYFGVTADYEDETLCFTEDELFSQAMLWKEHFDKFWAGGYEGVLGLGLDRFVMGMAVSAFDGGGDTVVVPYRNRDGGTTAHVRIIAAINRNASYPDYAFSVIDTIASESVMRDQALYGWSGSIVANTELGTHDKPLEWLPMIAENYDLYQELLGEINVVKYPTLLEQAVYEEIYAPCVHQEFEDEAAVRAAVHKTYMTMLMMLAES